MKCHRESVSLSPGYQVPVQWATHSSLQSERGEVAFTVAIMACEPLCGKNLSRGDDNPVLALCRQELSFQHNFATQKQIRLSTAD